MEKFIHLLVSSIADVLNFFLLFFLFDEVLHHPLSITEGLLILLLFRLYSIEFLLEKKNGK